MVRRITEGASLITTRCMPCDTSAIVAHQTCGDKRSATDLSPDLIHPLRLVEHHGSLKYHIRPLSTKRIGDRPISHERSWIPMIFFQYFYSIQVDSSLIFKKTGTGFLVQVISHHRNISYNVSVRTEIPAGDSRGSSRIVVAHDGRFRFLSQSRSQLGPKQRAGVVVLLWCSSFSKASLSVCMDQRHL
jgi:hypothetical protein